jgi:hypothetical protein
MKIHPVGAELLYTSGQTDMKQFFERAKNLRRHGSGHECNIGNVVDIHYQSARLANQKMPHRSFTSLMAETEHLLNTEGRCHHILGNSAMENKWKIIRRPIKNWHSDRTHTTLKAIKLNTLT